MKLYVYFGTGAGDYESILSIEDLKQKIESELTYTQQGISIHDENSNTLAYLPWYGVKAEQDDIVTVDFGDFGFYGEWLSEEK